MALLRNSLPVCTAVFTAFMESLLCDVHIVGMFLNFRNPFLYERYVMFLKWLTRAYTNARTRIIAPNANKCKLYKVTNMIHYTTICLSIMPEFVVLKTNQRV